jgi:hypothetical protein
LHSHAAYPQQNKPFYSFHINHSHNFNGTSFRCGAGLSSQQNCGFTEELVILLEMIGGRIAV